MRRDIALVLAAYAAAMLPAQAQQATELRTSIATEDEPALIDQTTTATVPRRTIAPEADPYAPLGIRAGGFILYPSLTTTFGYTTNSTGAAGGAGSAFGILTPELLIQSDWARHAASVKLRGSYERFFNGGSDKPSGSVEATGRVDFADGWTGDLAAGYTYDRQAISDPDFPAGADSPPGVHGLNASAGLTREAGRAKLTVEGSVDRTVYENATSGGVVVDQGDRTNSVYGARLRAGYEVTASLTPFVEGELSRRIYDRAIDNDGLYRSSVGTAYRAGVAFDHGPFFSGEAAVGYTQEDFDDAALATLSTLTFDGSLVWSPTTLTTITFNGATSLNPSAAAASAGSVVYDASVDLAYAWRRNFTVNWTGGLRHEQFQGTNQVDTGYRAGVSTTWKINRSLHLTAGYLHEWLVSNIPGRPFQSDAVRVELRAQR